MTPADHGKIVLSNPSLRSGLFWLLLALFFGGIPLIVYFTEPGAKIANLAMGIAVGLPLSVNAILVLGRSKALVLDPDRRTVCHKRGLYEGLRHETFDFKDVDRVETHTVHHSSVIRLVLKEGRIVILDRPDGLSASSEAQKLATILGVPLAPGS